jgi:hypothetical protein
MSKFESLVKQLVASDRRTASPRSWYDKLPADGRVEVDAIKKKLVAGEYGRTSKRALARAIVAAAKERGWYCTESGVREWLAKD